MSSEGGNYEVPAKKESQRGPSSSDDDDYHVSPKKKIKQGRPTSDYDEFVPSPKKSPKRGRPPGPPKSPGKKTGRCNGGDDSEKRTGPWSPEEENLMFKILYPTPNGVSWEAVSAKIPGRDALSCRNKHVQIRKKLDKMFL